MAGFVVEPRPLLERDSEIKKNFWSILYIHTLSALMYIIFTPLVVKAYLYSVFKLRIAIMCDTLT
jgi:hypothetical protein